jgi:hypothetical protein
MDEMNQFLIEDVTEAEVSAALASMKKGRSPGLDGLTS